MEPLQAYWSHFTPEEPKTQGMQEEVSPRSVKTVEKEDTLPETVANPREESEQCKMETKMLIIFLDVSPEAEELPPG